MQTKQYNLDYIQKVFKLLKKWLKWNNYMKLITFICILFIIGALAYLFCFAPKSNIDPKDIQIKTITVTNFQIKDNLTDLKKKYSLYRTSTTIPVKYKGKVYQAELSKGKENSNSNVIYKYTVIKYKGKTYDPSLASPNLRWAAWMKYGSLFPVLRDDQLIINTNTKKDLWKNPNQ